MKKGLTTYLTVALCATGLFVAGCGDDEGTITTSSTTSSTAATTPTGTTGAGGPALSEDEFVAQANEICKQGDAAIDAAGQAIFGGGQQPTEADQEAFIQDTVVPGIQAQIDALRALGAPEDIQDDLTSVLDDAEQTLGELEPSQFQGGTDPFADINKRLDALGLTECADDE